MSSTGQIISEIQPMEGNTLKCADHDEVNFIGTPSTLLCGDFQLVFLHNKRIMFSAGYVGVFVLLKSVDKCGSKILG